MSRRRIFLQCAPVGAGLVVAGALMLCTGAQAQTTSAIQNPLSPPSDSDQNIPSTYRKFKQVGPRAQVGPPPNFQPPSSGAGATGFDSTNVRKRKTPPRKSTDPKLTAPTPLATTKVPLVTTPVPAAPSVSSPAQTALAQAGPPGQPPVALTPTYTVPKRRKAHTEPDDPYAALGIKSGSFLLYPAIELSVGRNSNPSQVPGGRAATLYTAAPELRVQSDWSRHELKADLRGSYTGYSPDETPSLSRPYFNGKVDGRVDVTKNDRIDLGTRGLVSTDNPNSPNLQAGLSKLPVYTTIGGNAGYTHRFNRLDIGVKADAERTVYQSSQLTDGTTASNEDRNYNQYGGTLRAGYEISPGLKPYIEGGGDTRKHDLSTDFSGYQRNSNGYVAKIGATVELSRLLTGEAAIGYTKRNYEDARLAPLSGVIGSASLLWTPTALTSVKFTASSTVGESTTPDVSGVLYRDVGIQLDHAFRRWLIGTVKAGLGFDTYTGGTVPLTSGVTPLCSCVASTVTTTTPDRQDRRYSVGVGLTYKLNRMAQIKGEFRQDWLRSNVKGVDYTASIFLLGLRLQY
ncbi:MAG: outer membrane beta-barrel protein [Pseudolabrys sp.]|nr:outer membrane beta-barrel protein [Pseudolabrys sp.]